MVVNKHFMLLDHKPNPKQTKSFIVLSCLTSVISVPEK